MRTVTALEPERRGRVRVELDGEPWRTLPAAAVVSAGLLVGVTLDRQRARDLRRSLRRVEALNVAGRALSRRDRSVAELDAQLERRGLTAGERRAAVETMAELGYVDDARFAVNRAASLAARGYGDAAIVYDLEQRQVAAERVDEAIRSLALEADRARRVAARSSRTPEHLARALQAKGFSAESIDAVVEPLLG